MHSTRLKIVDCAAHSYDDNHKVIR